MCFFKVHTNCAVLWYWYGKVLYREIYTYYILYIYNELPVLSLPRNLQLLVGQPRQHCSVWNSPIHQMSWWRCRPSDGRYQHWTLIRSVFFCISIKFESQIGQLDFFLLERRRELGPVELPGVFHGSSVLWKDSCDASSLIRSRFSRCLLLALILVQRWNGCSVLFFRGRVMDMWNMFAGNSLGFVDSG